MDPEAPSSSVAQVRGCPPLRGTPGPAAGPLQQAELPSSSAWPPPLRPGAAAGTGRPIPSGCGGRGGCGLRGRKPGGHSAAFQEAASAWVEAAPHPADEPSPSPSLALTVPRPAAQASLSAAEQTAIGGASGVLEVFLQQPMVAVKNALQAGRPLPTALGVYYRGTVVNAASIAPITAIQFGFSQGLSDAFYGDKPPGTLGLLGTSGAAGAVSGFVSGPAEMVMIQQQGARTSGGIAHALRGD